MSLSSKSNADYGRIQYWNERYENDEEFEWCKEYLQIKPLLMENLSPGDAILILGCGNSELSSELYNDGFENITNIDFSSVVVSKMEEKYPNMKWITMDMLNLEFPPSTFDIVLEKATLDVLFVDEPSPWNVSEEVASNMEKVLKGVSSILKPDGKFISITWTQPHFRNKFYNKYWTTCKHSTFGTGFHYSFYLCSM